MKTITQAKYDRKNREYKLMVASVTYADGVQVVTTDEETRKTVSPKMARDLVLPPSALRDLGLV